LRKPKGWAESGSVRVRRRRRYVRERNTGGKIRWVGVWGLIGL